ncbi:uncharacterized protein LOC135498572 [Lineus longissimus]|uniref:uncharacterized protein LOC135498572 n=1 Tax=Lineus longissimus TaxID=88925 RepID=UPI002B4E61F8
MMRSLIFLIVAAVSVMYTEAFYGGGGYGNKAYGNSQGSSAYGGSQSNGAYGSTNSRSAYGSSGSSYGNNGHGSSGSTRRHHHRVNRNAIVAAAKKCHALRLKKMSYGSLTDEEEATLSGSQCANMLLLVDYERCKNIAKKLESGQTIADLDLKLKPKCRDIVTKVQSMLSRHRHGHGHHRPTQGGKFTREQVRSCLKLQRNYQQHIPLTEEDRQIIPMCKKLFNERNRVTCKIIAKARAQRKRVPAKYNRLERECPRILHASQRSQEGGTSNSQGAYGSQSSSYNRNSDGGYRSSSNYGTKSAYGGASTKGSYGQKTRHAWNPRKNLRMCSTGYKMNTTEKMKSNAMFNKCILKTKITTGEACASACLKCSRCNTATFISQANICLACKVYRIPGAKTGPELAPCPICTVYQKACKAEKNPFLTPKKNPFLKSEMKRGT